MGPLAAHRPRRAGRGRRREAARAVGHDGLPRARRAAQREHRARHQGGRGRPLPADVAAHLGGRA